MDRITQVSIRKHHDKPNRKYHNAAHLDHVLRMFRVLCVHDKISLSEEVKLAAYWAIAFHDWHIVAAKGVSAEDRSILVAKSKLKRTSVNAGLVETLINGTKHSPGLIKKDLAAYISDADLSILGSSKAIYKAYIINIKMECLAVYKITDAVYTKKRIEVLESFLVRNKQEKLFLTPAGKRFEKAATRNLQYELNSLQKQG